MQVHAQATLQHAGQEAAGAKTDDEDAVGGQDGIDRLLTGGGIQALQVALGVADVFFEGRGKDLHRAGRVREFGAQFFDRLQRRLETACQFGAELRVTGQVQGARETVGRGDRHARRRREFVDGHRGDAELVRQDVLGHLVLRAAQRGLGPGDPISDRECGLVHRERGGKRSEGLCKSVYTQILDKKIHFHTKGIPVNLCNSASKETGPV